VLVVEADGLFVRLLDDWHEMTVGCVGGLRPGQRAVQRTGCCAGLEGAEAFWQRLHVLACAHGLRAGPQTVEVLGDGAEWIWNRAAAFLGGGQATVIEVLDNYHACGHVWDAARAVHGDDAAAAAAWARQRTDELRTAGVAPVLAALRAPTPPTDAAQEEVQRVVNYVTTHAARMAYPQELAQGLPIGSGAIESRSSSLLPSPCSKSRVG